MQANLTRFKATPNCIQLNDSVFRHIIITRHNVLTSLRYDSIIILLITV